MLHDHLLTFHGAATVATTTGGQVVSDPINIGSGTPGNRALFAEVPYTAAYATASGTATFTVQECDTASGSYTPLSSQDVPLASSANAKQGTLYIPVVTRKPYVKLATTLTGGGGTVTYTAFLVTGKPV